MMGKRKRYSAEFKAKVAMEALRGELTTSQLATKHGVHQTMIGEWKRQAMEGLVTVFSGKAEAKEGIREEELEKLHAKIGQLVVERDFWRKRPVDEHRAAAFADLGRSRGPVDCPAMRVGVDQPVLVLLSADWRDGGEPGADAFDRRAVPGTPWYGSRQMAAHLRRDGHEIGRKRVRRLMAIMGLAAIYQRPRTTVPHPENRIYPYLLQDMVVDRPNQVWCADITYIPMRRGFLYLVAVMDWATRKVLAWRVSNTMDTAFCIEALHEALARFGRPEIFNTDQGSQFTSQEFTPVLRAADVRISMDGRGRWMDNVFIERLWRSLKYECVYLHAFETGSALRAGLGHWIGYYNMRRPHTALAGRTPDEAYGGSVIQRLAA